MLSIVDWAICCCASFNLRVCVEYHRYCSTCIHLIFHEADRNLSHHHADKIYNYGMIFA
ncbi:MULTISPECIES: hypothetical protein [unclassified Nostoc]|uniref:hypothetical protein n=1 Tax=unclassified Nostoc TaxID=2593658 RepID=UPI001DA6CC9B|nr:hypothetical protein [Nostoc sp. JL23]MBN3881318.1 hypothetical protein [Nostoc sp. JL23]